MPDSVSSAVDLIYEMMSSGDMSRLDEVVARDLIDHESMPGITSSGSQRLRDFVAVLHGTFSDLKIDPVDVILDGDRVAVRCTMSGRHTGDKMGIPATGKNFSVEGMDFMHFADGKCVEHWGMSDQFGMMQQLGLMPAQ